MASLLRPQQTVGVTRRTITPNSALLQELLEEQRGRKASQTNSAISLDSKASLDDRQVQSSPAGQPKPTDSSSKEHARRNSDPINRAEEKEAEAKKDKAVRHSPGDQISIVTDFSQNVDKVRERRPETSEQRGRSGSGGSGGSAMEVRRPREMGIRETNAVTKSSSKDTRSSLTTALVC